MALVETDERSAALRNGARAIFPGMDAAADERARDSGSVDAHLRDLLSAICRRDRAAFEEFYDATTGRVLSFVTRIVRLHDVAEEVVSDVYLQVWRQAGRFDQARGNVLAWLMTISRSRALDALRRMNVAPTSGAAPVTDIAEAGESESLQDLLAAIEERTALHSALERLDPDHRQLLALAFFRGYSHSELAEFTGKPLGTVKTQVRRTLIKLKELLRQAEQQEKEHA